MEERIARVLDQLFAAPREEFIAVRKKLVAELKAHGQKEDAKIVGAIQKPTATAWAINHVATHHAPALAAFLKATTRLRDAQTEALRGGDAQAFRGANRELAACIAEIVELAKTALAESGGEASVVQLRRISQSLHATPFSGPDEIARLARGHLEKDLEAPSDFGVFAGAVPERPLAEAPPRPRTPPPPAPAPRPPPHADLAAKLAKKREAEAREAKERKEKEEREAREKKRALIKAAKAEALELEKVARLAEKNAAEARRTADAAAAHARALEESE